MSRSPVTPETSVWTPAPVLSLLCLSPLQKPQPCGICRALGRTPGPTQRATERRLPWLREGGQEVIILLRVSVPWQWQRDQ